MCSSHNPFPLTAIFHYVLLQILCFQNGSPNELSLVLDKNITWTYSKINDIVFTMDCGKENETKLYALKNTTYVLSL